MAKIRIKRTGPISPELLPIPTEDEYAGLHGTELYSTGPNGSWKREELPASFYDELRDLLGRYGGVDGDGDSRLQATIVDRTKHDTFHFRPVGKGWDHQTMDQLLTNLTDHMVNQEIAQDNVMSTVREIRYVQEEASKTQTRATAKLSGP